MASGLQGVTDRAFARRPSLLAGTRVSFDFRLATPCNSMALASRSKMKQWYFLSQPSSRTATSKKVNPCLPHRTVPI